MTNLYNQLKDKIVGYAKAMKDAPGALVWMHEKAFYNVVKIKRLQTLGQRDVMHYLLNGMKNGYVGNKRKKEMVMLGYAAADTMDESCGNDYNLWYQINGEKEVFVGGKLSTEETEHRPKWFRTGQTLTNVKMQTEIVNELIDDSDDLDEKTVQRRRGNYQSFVAHIDETNGYL